MSYGAEWEALAFFARKSRDRKSDPTEPTKEWLAEKYPGLAEGARFGIWSMYQPSAFVRYMMTREEFCETWPWEDPDEYGLHYTGAPA